MDEWQACLRLEPSKDPHVENGMSYERATFDFSRFRGLVVPEGATVRRGLGADAFNVYVEKTLAYTGWPDKKVSIADQRTKMGVAYRVNGQNVALATFGEWASPDGSGSVKLCVIIPADLEILKREDVGGVKSIANSQKPGDVGPGSGQPRPGWTILATQPNVEAIRI